MTTNRRIVLASIAVVAGAAFVVLALAVTHGWAPLLRLDIAWHQGLRRFGLDHAGWLSAMRAITHIGDTVTILVVDVSLFVLCLVRRWIRRAIFVAIVGLGGWALRLLIRDIVDRPRPEDPLWSADSASFPSGHTTNATLMVVLLLVVGWPLLGPATRYVAVAAGVLVALAVGLSRVAGAVHWPTDVLGGLLLATGYVSLVAAVFPPGPAPGADPPTTAAVS